MAPDNELILLSLLLILISCIILLIYFFLTRCPGYLCISTMRNNQSNTHNNFDEQLCPSCYKLYEKKWKERWKKKYVSKRYQNKNIYY